MGVGTLLYPLLSDTSVFDPAYSMVVCRFLYEFIIDSRTYAGSPRLFRAASRAVCGTVSKALAISICVGTSPLRPLAALIVSLKMWTLLERSDVQIFLPW
jgi:hypothetical protein